MVADALVERRAALPGGYRRAGSRIAIQLIADQSQVLAGGRVEVCEAAGEYDDRALTPINVIQKWLIKERGSADVAGRHVELNLRSSCCVHKHSDNGRSCVEVQVP